MLTNTLTDDMLRSCVLTPINVKPELSKTLKFPHLHPLKLTLEKSATFSKMQQKPIGTTFRSGVLNLMKKLKSGMAHKNGVGVEREITIPLKGVSKFSDRSLTIVEEHLSLFDSHSEFIPLNSGDEETSDDPLFFITSSESEGSSMKSPSENDPNLPLIQVEPGSAPATDELEFFHPSRIRKRACTMPSLCRCDSACGDPACSLSLTVPNMLTNRQSSEKYGSPTNLKLVKLPVVKKKSSESDLSMIPKGISGSYEAHVSHISRQISGSQYMYGLQHEMPEYPFLTLSIYPRSFVVHIGGIVSARSVKLLDRITNPDEPETRDAWWAELRMEIRSHARTLGCTFVLGYTEQTSICDEVCILSASGTAAVVDFQQLEPQEVRTRNSSGSCFGMTSSFEKDKSFKDQRVKDSSNLPEAQEYLPCSPCHVPYARTTIPCPVKLARCNVCRKYKVPDVLLATIEVPKGVSVEGKGSLIQARVCRSKREYRGGGDSQAKEVSDALPFLEYELHRQLLAKLRVRGMNAIFGLNVAVSIGDKQLIGVATGTALYLSSLPPSRPPTLSGTGSKEDQLKVAQLSKKLMEYLIESREFYGIEDSTVKNLQENGEDDSDHSDLSDDEIPDLFIPGDAKDTCVLEIDDPSELDIASILADGRPPRTFYSCTTEKLPGLNWSRLESNYLSFTRVWQGRGAYSSQKQLDGCFNTLLQGLYFQLRKASPCLISGLKFSVDLPDEEIIQVTISGTASKLKEASFGQEANENKNIDGPLMFKLDEDPHFREKKPQAKMESHSKIEAAHSDHPVIEITPLSQVPGSRIDKYLGNLNFFFIRESTSIRECGGFSTLVASFISEVFAIARAHVAALGGNAMVSFTMSQYVLEHNSHKNQGQCLINASGDAVFLSDGSSEE